MSTRLLVCGSRTYSDREFLWRVLDNIRARHDVTEIIHGAAMRIVDGNRCGADWLADEWALSRGVDVIRYPANWSGRGNAAGPHRNGRMLSHGQPHLVVAFPGNTGTANMVAQALAAGIRVISGKNLESYG